MAIDRAKQQGEPDVEELLDELTQKIERLRVLYEQYFMGIERMEPSHQRKEVSRGLLDIAQLHIRNTGLRYRFNTLNQKFSVYGTYWNRTLRQIENGTYFRDVVRAGRNAASRGVDMPDEVLKALPPRLREKIIKDRANLKAGQARADEKAARRKEIAGGGATPAPVAAPLADDSDIDSALDNLFGEAEAAVTSTKPEGVKSPTVQAGAAKAPTVPPAKPPTVPPAASKTVPPAAKPPIVRPPPIPPGAAAAKPPPIPPGGARKPPPGVAEGTAQDIFKKFVQAKRLLGENADNIKLEHIEDTIAKQAPAIMKQHQAKGVEFQVVIKDEKVILKATPKK